MTTTEAPAGIPARVQIAERVAKRGGYKLSSEPRVGALLRTLAATKPGGRFLELGSGVGVGASWLLDGMDADARLTTIEIQERVCEVCRRVLADDDRAEAVNADADEWLAAYTGPPFDFVFVDTTSAKFDGLETVLGVLETGALYVTDDLLPQEKWSDTHPERVAAFRQSFLETPELVPVLLDWASGVGIAAYRGPAA